MSQRRQSNFDFHRSSIPGVSHIRHHPLKRYYGMVQILDTLLKRDCKAGGAKCQVYDLGPMKDILCETYKVEPIPREINQLKEMIEKEEVDKAMQAAAKQAKLISFQGVQFELGQFCGEMDMDDKAYDFYEAIEKDNPYYQKAQERKLDILGQQQNAAMQGLIETSEEEKRDLLKTELTILLGIPDEQKRLDLKLNDLCGMPLGSAPILNNARYDMDTVLDLCSYIQKLHLQLANKR